MEEKVKRELEITGYSTKLEAQEKQVEMLLERIDEKQGEIVKLRQTLKSHSHDQFSKGLSVNQEDDVRAQQLQMLILTLTRMQLKLVKLEDEKWQMQEKLEQAQEVLQEYASITVSYSHFLNVVIMHAFFYWVLFINV